jgi:hypothetical protein
MQPIFTLSLWILIGGITAHYAKARGRDPRGWFCIGLLLGIFGLLLLFILPKIMRKTHVTLEPAPALALPLLENPHPDKFWYYLDSSNSQFGPMSFQALQTALEQGKITQQTLVWNEEFESWKPLQETQKK